MAVKGSIIFFGTGPTALASVIALSEHFDVEATITKADHQTHSGTVIEQSVKLWSDTRKIPCFQPANRAEHEQLFKQQGFKSYLGVVVDYGILIPSSVIRKFKLGIVNSHFSLLPEHRGASPITAAILSGQPKTGVSLMLITEKLDEGPLLAQASYEIPPNMSANKLRDELTKLSNSLLISALTNYLDGKLVPRPQPRHKRVSYTRKLAKVDGIIDWNKPAKQIEREIRAYLGWPTSRTTYMGKDIAITKARVSEAISASDKDIGKFFVTNNKELAVKSKDGVLIIERLKPAGKKEISDQDFIRGYMKS